MRIQIQKYEDLVCMSVRGQVNDNLIDVLFPEVEKLIVESKVSVILNFSLADMSAPGASTIRSALNMLKSEVAVDILIIGGGTRLEEFPSFDSYLQSQPFSKFRQALLHLKQDEKRQHLEEKIKAAESALKELSPEGNYENLLYEYQITEFENAHLKKIWNKVKASKKTPAPKEAPAIANDSLDLLQQKGWLKRSIA